MGEDIQARLRRLGVVRGARNLKPASEQVRPPAGSRLTSPQPASQLIDGDETAQELEILLPGIRLIETDAGACLALDRVYPLSYRHGDDTLIELRQLPTGVAADFCQEARLAGLSADDLVFIDTETTGLSGTGTLAFMVGVAFFEGDALVVRQYFLRDHGDEPAMLHLLSGLADGRTGLVTFNGRAFDLPLLGTRFLMNRLDGLGADLSQRPHIDLLPPARRLWRRRLGACSLGALEKNLLGLQRTQEDVPGWAIPGLYLEYLRTGDARPLSRVFYHNRIDMLSMVTLAGRVVRQFALPRAGDDAQDLISLARWQSSLGLEAQAEENLWRVVNGDPPLDDYQVALMELAGLLKRAERFDEAVPLWQQVAVTSLDDVNAHVELAKYHEWRSGDLAAALEWSRQALRLADSWPSSQALTIRPELLHRLARLEAKLARRAEG